MKQNAKRLLPILLSGMFAMCGELPSPAQVVFQKAGGGAGIHVNPASGLATTEGGGSATFAVSLVTKPAANVTVTLSSGNTAEGQIRQTAGACVTGGTAGTGSCTLTFTPTDYLNPQSVAVVGQNDDDVDGQIAYTINLSAASTDGNYAGKTTTVSLTNSDNDAAGFTATPSTTLVTKNDGATATSQIRLSSRPTANVTFTIRSDNTAGGDVTTPASKTFTFTNANWNTAQNLVVTGGATAPLDYKIVIDGAVTSGDPNYSGVTGTLLHTGISVKNFPAGDRFIFVTNSSYPGDLGGISGADTKCNADANKPNGSTYKAMLVGGTRRACSTVNCSGGASEHLDWVLYPNTTYIRSPGLVTIGTTNATVGIFPFSLTNAFGTSGSFTWTGMTTAWQNNSTCSVWTSIVASGTYGIDSSTTTSALSFGTGTCGSGSRLYCVEQ